MEGWKELKQDVGDFMCKVDAKIGQIEKTEKEAYERGLKIGEKIGMEKAWDAARQVSNMTLKTQKTIFSVEGTSYVVGKYSAAEAMERIRNYESEKPEEYKFNPGDEIVYKADHNIRVCVTSVKLLCLQRNRENSFTSQMAIIILTIIFLMTKKMALF